MRSLVAGGNANAGISSVVISAILDSLVHPQNLALHVIWRIAYTATALVLFFPKVSLG